MSFDQDYEEFVDRHRRDQQTIKNLLELLENANTEIQELTEKLPVVGTPGRDYQKLFNHGNKAQLEKLISNDHKTGWEGIDLNYAVSRCEGEVEELWAEVFIEHSDMEKIRLEAADVANFAHMIILECDRRIKVEDGPLELTSVEQEGELGEEINIEKIEVVRGDAYQIDLRNEDTGQLIRTFIRRDALYALIAVAEK